MHVPHSRTVTIAGVECYVAGSGSLCVVVGYDVFGFKVKNTRHNVDELARIIPDSTVVMPARYRRPANRRLPRAK